MTWLTFWQFWKKLKILTIIDNFWQMWQFLTILTFFLTIIDNLDKFYNFDNFWQNWHLWSIVMTFLHFVKIETSIISYSWNIFSPQVSFFCPFYRFNDLHTFLGMKFDLKILLCVKEFDIFATLGKHVPHLHWYASAALNGS